MRRPDIIVVGTGRSGTSFIAEILHNKFEIHMANQWDTLECNPTGSFEDQKMMEISRYLTEKPGYTVREWLSHYYKGFKDKGDIVGLKCCQLSLLSRKQWEDINPKLVIRTYRPLPLTVDSMMRWREPKNEDYWVDYYHRREKCMQNNLDWGHAFPVLRINFGFERMFDIELTEILSPWISRFEDGTI